MITVMVTTEAERQDVLEAFRDHLGGTTPFEVYTDGQRTDRYPSGHAGVREADSR